MDVNSRAMDVMRGKRVSSSGGAEWTRGKNASEASVEEDGKSETGDDKGRWVHGFTRADREDGMTRVDGMKTTKIDEGGG